jgi:hypothetical protein
MKRFFLFIVIITLAFGLNNMYSIEFTLGFYPHAVYNNMADTIFNINAVNDIIQINYLFDSLDAKFEISSKTIALSFNKLDENQIDSSIKLFKYKNCIQQISFLECPIKKLPDSFNLLYYVNKIQFRKCDSIVSMNNFNSDYSIICINFINCRIKKLPDGLENIFPMLSLILILPDDFNGMSINNELLKFEKRKNIIDLFIRYSQLDKFPESIFNLINLQTLFFIGNNIIYYPAEFDKFVNMRQIYISCNDDRVEESAKKITTLNYFRRLRNGDFKSELSLDHILTDCRSDKSKIIDSQHRLFFTKKFYTSKNALDFSLQLDNHNIFIEPNPVEGNIKLNFKDLKTNDVVNVTFSDSTDKFLYSAKEKINTAVIVLNGYIQGFYYVKVNINYLSIKFQVVNDEDRRK